MNADLDKVTDPVVALEITHRGLRQQRALDPRVTRVVHELEALRRDDPTSAWWSGLGRRRP